MRVLDDRIEAVKASLTSGTASTLTVTSLQLLLGQPTSSQPSKKKATVSGQPNDSKYPPKKSGVRVQENPSAFCVYDDVGLLSAKARYGLATEVVNISLKALSRSTERASHASVLPEVTTTGIRPGRPAARRSSTTSTVSQRALLPRSGNATQVIQSRISDKGSEQFPPPADVKPQSVPSLHVDATAECARLGLAYLRSVDPEELGLRAVPSIQLEHAMLALSSRLVALGLASLASKELRLLKHYIEKLATQDGRAKSAAKKSSSASPMETVKESCASLLCVSAAVTTKAELLSLAVSYQMLVLKFIASTNKPAVIDACIVHLDPESATSPANLIKEQARHSKDISKAARQLESLSQILLSICASVAPSTHENATSFPSTSSPAAIFQLQMYALQIRKQWWALVNHQPDVAKELVAPYAKSLAAFVRRSIDSRSQIDVYNFAKASYSRLSLGQVSSASSIALDMHRTLSSLAERAAMNADAHMWTKTMLEDCKGLGEDHARFAAVLTRQLALAGRVGSIVDECHISALEKALSGPLNGKSAEYDLLLEELESLVKAIGSNSIYRKVLRKAGRFTQKYVRSYPERKIEATKTIVLCAVRNSKTNEDLLTWVTNDATKAFIQAGVLRHIADLARIMPAGESWSTSVETLSLGRILHTEIFKALQDCQNGEPINLEHYDGLDVPERAALLHWRLTSAVEFCQRPKYTAALQQMLSTILQELTALCPAEDHPLRRADLEITVLRLREENPNLLSSEAFEKLLDTSEVDASDLGRDDGLSTYAEDIKATHQLCRAFYHNRPTVANLQSIFEVWQRIVDTATSSADVKKAIYEHERLLMQLSSSSSYLAALGEEAACISLQHLITRLCCLLESSVTDRCKGAVRLAQLYLQVGEHEKAGHILEQTDEIAKEPDVPLISQLQLYLVHAEYSITLGDANRAEKFLLKAKSIRDALTPEKIQKSQRKTYELLHAQGWMVQSSYHVATGAVHSALALAKHTVKLLNSMWSAYGRKAGKTTQELETNMVDATTDLRVDRPITSVSKLQLVPDDDCKDTREDKGAAFWPLVPLLCMALMHLSDMYARHGVFLEAEYYSTRSIEIAESVHSAIWLARVHTHRCRVLVAANRLDEAELSLAKCHPAPLRAISIDTAEFYRAQAAVRSAEGSFAEASELLQKAEKVLQQVQDASCRANSGRFPDSVEALAAGMGSLTMEEEPRKFRAGRKKMIQSVPTRRVAPIKRWAKPTKTVFSALPAEQDSGPVSALRAQLALEKISVAMHLGHDQTPCLAVNANDLGSTSSPLWQILQARSIMQRVNTFMQSDLSFNILPESTLCFPALEDADVGSEQGENMPTGAPGMSIAKRSHNANLASAKGRKRTPASADSLADLLSAVRACLILDHASIMQYGSTAETHLRCSMLLSVTTFLRAAAPDSLRTSLHPASQAMHGDESRIKALDFERRAVLCDVPQDDSQAVLSWPAVHLDEQAQTVTTAADYQRQYVDILPQPWTAISITMDEKGTELYLARYRSGRIPFTVRLPFSRQISDDEDQDAVPFDYAAAKAELQDIIQASNNSCHNTNNISEKGAKNSWWAERETLDKRLHELLINMESIWLGGFKSVLSQARTQPELLAAFRKSFDEILGCYLPSRKRTRGRSKQVALDDRVLELFTGLGDDKDGVVDLDEPLADLLYFVVDMLQFHGERNAYDEIDFDSMVVDVLDALRSYHEACKADLTESQHMILVLDKRLQAFPWESLPCLETASVSRVGSMNCLRERILAMRNINSVSSEMPQDGHVVDRNSGAYILNPSNDLAHTQKTLSPALSNLTSSTGAGWTSTVAREPTEAEFTTSLTKSSILLYFGHGAGSQYIRPRTIKKLETCSEVVWLMGCSSGAVTEYGELEPFAVPLAYMLAAGNKPNEQGRGKSIENNDKEKSGDRRMCMAVIATLWDVTDKDIDRFSLAVGEEWGLWPASEASKLLLKSSKKQSRRAAPSTPQQVPKTPKTPKTRKTPAPSRTPARSHSRPAQPADGRKRSLVEAVARSRDTCYLRYLNGAAPVVYGIPVYLGD